jgi:hypothetical protein
MDDLDISENHVGVDVILRFNNVASIPVGEVFAIHSQLGTTADLNWGVALGEPDTITAQAIADFFNTSSFTLSTSTPGVTISQVGGPSPAAVLEPSSLVLFGMGSLGLLGYVRRRRICREESAGSDGV